MKADPNEPLDAYVRRMAEEQAQREGEHSIEALNRGTGLVIIDLPPQMEATMDGGYEFVQSVFYIYQGNPMNTYRMSSIEAYQNWCRMHGYTEVRLA
jgi:hypothetical protein